jgi:hypothetical protein
MKSAPGRQSLIIFFNEDHPNSPVNFVMSKRYIRPLGAFFGWSGALKVEELGCPQATLKSTGWSLCTMEKD